MDVLIALCSALVFGVGDYLIPNVSRKEGATKTALYVQLFGFLAVLPFALFRLTSIDGDQYPRALLLGLFAGILLGAACFFFVLAFKRGPLLIVSPITSTYPALTVVLALFWGEVLSSTQIAGFVVTLAGVVMCVRVAPARSAARHVPAAGGRSGVYSAIWASVMTGLALWVMGLSVLVLGSTVAVAVTRVAAFLLLLVAIMATRRTLRLRERSSLRILVIAGSLFSLGSLLYGWALTFGQISTSSVIMSLYSVVTMLLGRILGGQRLTRSQGLGVVITLLGVALVSMRG